jgi:sulfatase maturation enzyme AslB (radical SAM superfamily)
MTKNAMKNNNLSNPEGQEYLARRIMPGGTYEDLVRFPRYLEIETVNVCNARCPMCTIADWERGHTPMKDALYKKIASEVIEHSDQVKRVSLYRDGEPLIDKKLASRTAVLKDGGVKEVAISTNVSLLDGSRSYDLLHAGMDTVIMSIDSLNKEVFESIRVRLVFEEVMENVHRFIQLRNQIRPETRIWMRMIRQAENKDEWPDYQRYWSRYVGDQDRIYYRNIFNWGGQLDGFTPIAKSFEPNLPCVALWSLMVIFCNGDVPLCNVDFNNKYPTGSVLTQSIEELWQSKVVAERRDLHLTGQKSKISLCDNCNVWDESPIGDGISGQYATEMELKM